MSNLFHLYTGAELKEELRTRGLPTGGKKPALLQRLQDHEDARKASVQRSVAVSPAEHAPPDGTCGGEAARAAAAAPDEGCANRRDGSADADRPGRETPNGAASKRRTEHPGPGGGGGAARVASDARRPPREPAPAPSSDDGAAVPATSDADRPAKKRPRDPSGDGSPFRGYTVNELKRELRQRGLRVSGGRPQLLQRLQEYEDARKGAAEGAIAGPAADAAGRSPPTDGSCDGEDAREAAAAGGAECEAARPSKKRKRTVSFGDGGVVEHATSDAERSVGNGTTHSLEADEGTAAATPDAAGPRQPRAPGSSGANGVAAATRDRHDAQRAAAAGSIGSSEHRNGSAEAVRRGGAPVAGAPSKRNAAQPEADVHGPPPKKARTSSVGEGGVAAPATCRSGTAACAPGRPPAGGACEREEAGEAVVEGPDGAGRALAPDDASAESARDCDDGAAAPATFDADRSAKRRTLRPPGDDSPFRGSSVRELKEELRQRKLRVSGTRPQLLQRLQEYENARKGAAEADAAGRSPPTDGSCDGEDAREAAAAGGAECEAARPSKKRKRTVSFGDGGVVEHATSDAEPSVGNGTTHSLEADEGTAAATPDAAGPGQPRAPGSSGANGFAAPAMRDAACRPKKRASDPLPDDVVRTGAARPEGAKQHRKEGPGTRPRATSGDAVVCPRNASPRPFVAAARTNRSPSPQAPAVPHPRTHALPHSYKGMRHAGVACT